MRDGRRDGARKWLRFCRAQLLGAYADEARTRAFGPERRLERIAPPAVAETAAGGQQGVNLR